MSEFSGKNSGTKLSGASDLSSSGISGGNSVNNSGTKLSSPSGTSDLSLSRLSDLSSTAFFAGSEHSNAPSSSCSVNKSNAPSSSVSAVTSNAPSSSVSTAPCSNVSSSNAPCSNVSSLNVPSPGRKHPPSNSFSNAQSSVGSVGQVPASSIPASSIPPASSIAASSIPGSSIGSSEVAMSSGSEVCVGGFTLIEGEEKLSILGDFKLGDLI